MRTSLPRAARIVSAVQEGPRVRSLTLDLHLEAEPGQFVMAWLPGVEERPFSLAHAGPVMLTIARVGPLTEAVHALEPGDRLWARGPLGRPFTLPVRVPPRGPEHGGAGVSDAAARRACLLVAGGYGAAPLHFLAERALAAGWQVVAVIGARTAEDIVLAGRFDALGSRVVIATDDGSLGERGLATDAAARLLAEQRFAALYACGPEPMLQAVERLARERCLPAQLSYERTMRCAFGVCGSCAHQGWLVCRDGPVRSI